MRRLLALILAVLCVLSWPSLSFAENCAFCHVELEEGVNKHKCPNCIKLAANIARNHKKVWVLDFRPKKIARVQIKDDTGDVESYWYLHYTLANKDATAHDFFLDIKAVSDRGKKKYRYHDLLVPDVYAEIRKRMGLRKNQQLLNKKQLSMPPPDKQNRLPRVRDERTKQTAQIALPTIQPKETLNCVAILGPFDREMDKLEISIRGLTNTSLKSHDAYVRPDGKPHRRVVKEAVLVLTYRRPGDEFSHNQDPLRYVGRRWVDVPRTLKSDLKSLR